MLGIQYIASVCTKGTVNEFLSSHLDEKFFKADEIDIFNYVDLFVSKHHSLPTLETVKAKFPTVTDWKAPEPCSYYAEQVLNRHVFGLYNKALSDSSNYLVKKDIDSTTKLLMQTLDAVLALQQKDSITNFTQEGYDLVLANHKSKLLGTQDTIPYYFGWEYLDDSFGGSLAGDFVSIVGRPSLGKTWLLLFIAIQIWRSSGEPVLFASMEMNTLAICQRLVAMVSSIPLTHIKKAQITSKQMTKIKDDKSVIETLPNFYIVNGNLNSDVKSIDALCSILSPSALFIDGAYLLTHPNPKMEKFARVADNAEKLKALIERRGLRGYFTYQFNRVAAAKSAKKVEKVGLEDIAYADAIGQISSLVLGLFEPESVETLIARQVEVLKGRDGQTGSFKINWDFDYMDFTQYKEPTVEDLNYI